MGRYIMRHQVGKHESLDEVLTVKNKKDEYIHSGP